MTKRYVKVNVSKELLLRALHLNTDPKAQDIDIVGVEYNHISIALILSSGIFPETQEGEEPQVASPTITATRVRTSTWKNRDTVTIIDWGLPEVTHD